MPTYTYACTDCDNQLEVVQSFTADPLTECPQCQGRLRKVFHPVGVVFKGSGFYRTDSRSGGKSGSRPSTAESTSSEKDTKGGANGKSTASADTAGSGSSGTGSSGSSTAGSASSGSTATSSPSPGKAP